MYNWDRHSARRIVGKYDEAGEWILPSTNELTPARIAARHRQAPPALPHHRAHRAACCAGWPRRKPSWRCRARNFPRVPHYCSGCPHNTSTVVPEGSRALGGIGCHYMVTWMDRNTDTFTHMGGEGVTWCGPGARSPNDQHVFQNLGDGTYFHSGSLAIRQSIAAGVNITYKILYNDAVAMTGGQPVDGTLSVPQIAHQVRSEGVQTIVVLSRRHRQVEQAARSSRPASSSSTATSSTRCRSACAKCRAPSVLIYDQTCATEKRRRRKRGKMVDPPKRVMVNSLVCEGCGDCGEKSFCVSVLPKETEFGRKREIDQSNCNKDYSCVKGFCPSFVTVQGGGLRKQKAASAKDRLRRPADAARCRSLDAALEHPDHRRRRHRRGHHRRAARHGRRTWKARARPCSTRPAWRRRAARSPRTSASRKTPADIHAVRIAAGEADLVLGCDMVVVNDYWALSKIRAGRTHVVLNTYEAMPGTFTTRPDMQFPAADIVAAVTHRARRRSDPLRGRCHRSSPPR